MSNKIKQNYRLIQSCFLSEDYSQSKSSITIQMLGSTCSPPFKMNQHIVIDGNTLIFLTGSCIQFHNFFQSNKIFLASINRQLHEKSLIDKNQQSQLDIQYEYVGFAGNSLGKNQVVVASQPKNDRTYLFISKYCTNDEFVPTISFRFIDQCSADESKFLEIQLIDILFYGQSYIILALKTISSSIDQKYIIVTITLQGINNAPKSFIKYSSSNFQIQRLLKLEENIGIILNHGICVLVNEQYTLPQGKLPIEVGIRYKNMRVLDYYEQQNQLRIVLYQENNCQYLLCQWAAETCKDNIMNVRNHVENDQMIKKLLKHKQNIEIYKMIKVNKHILLIHKNIFAITHLTIDEDGFKFIANYTYSDYSVFMGIQRAGVLNIQASQDQMHIIITVYIETKTTKQLKIQNLLFNLSATAGSRKFINLFTRLSSNYPSTGNFKSMESTLSSASYLLIGSKISSFLYLNSVPSQQSVIATPFASHQSPKCMTVHPLGYQFVLVFDNIVRFYNKINSVSSLNQNVGDNIQQLGTIQDTGLELVEVWSEQYLCLAAKYSQAGALALCCIQDSQLKIMIYDSYKFKLVKIVTIMHMHLNGRNTVDKIQWCLGDSAIKIFLGSITNSQTQTSTDLILINLYNSQRLRQFRQRDPKLSCFKIKCIDYEEELDRLIASVVLNIDKTDPIRLKVNQQLGFKEKYKNFIIYASKDPQSHDITLSTHRVIIMPEPISCIKICNSLKVVFFGSSSGRLYWTSYPLQITPIDYYSMSAQQCSFFQINANQLQSLHLNNNQISSIQLTGNNKFVIVYIQNQGYFTFKARRSQVHSTNNRLEKQSNNMNLVFQELGNPIFNTIVTTTISSYSVKKQLLKNLLQKRKSCFTDLQEFRKEFQISKRNKLTDISKFNKNQQLITIKQELTQIQNYKVEKNRIIEQINQLSKQQQRKKNQITNKCQKSLLNLYKEQDKQKNTLKTNQQRYQKIYDQAQQSCSINLANIQSDLSSKYCKFQSNYNLMISNLRNFQKRVPYQNQMHEEQINEELKNLQQTLEMQQQTIKSKINNISLTISSIKKNNERYGHRKSFLQHKYRHFVQQHHSNQQQKIKLLELKQQLFAQLLNLEQTTQKKQRLLNNILNINDSLNKYKDIHEVFVEMSLKQIKQIKNGSSECEAQIIQVMDELIKISQQNSQNKQKIHQTTTNIEKLSQQSLELNQNLRKYGKFTEKILKDIETYNEIEDNAQKGQKMNQIYQQYYIRDNLLKMLQSASINKVKQKDDEKQSKLKDTQVILDELKDHKQYILNNFKLLQTYNNRIKEQINLNFLRIQAQNYDLISECNTRKDQTIKKKKLLHQLIDSVKETQIYLGQMKKQAQQIQKKQLENENQLLKSSFGAAKTFYRTMSSKSKQNNKNLKFSVVKSGSKIQPRYSTGNLLNKKYSTNNQAHKKKNQKDTPFVIYQRNKNQQNVEQNKGNCNGSRVYIKKMLGITKLNNNDNPYERRIKTALNRNHQPINLLEPISNYDQQANSFRCMKPMTAKLRTQKQNRKTMKSASNSHKYGGSSSKPTTAHTKSKISMMI